MLGCRALKAPNGMARLEPNPPSTTWLGPLGLQGRPTIIDDDGTSFELPEWAAFLLWTGWWMRRNQHKAIRFVMVLLLPKRACCSAFCALGAMLGSLHRGAQKLNWNQFQDLPAGERIFLKVPDLKGTSAAEAEVEGWQTLEGRRGRSVRLISPRRLARTKSKQFLFPTNFQRFEFSRTPHLATREKNTLGPIGDFYQSLNGSFDQSWLRSQRTECLVITNRAKWERELEGLALAPPKGESCSLPELPALLLSASGSNRRKTLVCSHRAVPSRRSFPTVVLDGPRALRLWESIAPSNVLILLSQAEYDESDKTLLRDLVAARVETVAELVEIPAEAPPATEIAVLALKRPTMR